MRKAMRVDAGKPKESISWILLVLELLKHKGPLTGRELAGFLGKSLGRNALSRCRKVGIPLDCIRFRNGRSIRRKRYTLHVSMLWNAIEEAVRQIDQQAVILRGTGLSNKRRTYKTVAAWIQHVQRLERLKNKKSVANDDSLHLIQAASRRRNGRHDLF